MRGSLNTPMKRKRWKASKVIEWVCTNGLIAGTGIASHIGVKIPQWRSQLMCHIERSLLSGEFFPARPKIFHPRWWMVMACMWGNQTVVMSSTPAVSGQQDQGSRNRTRAHMTGRRWWVTLVTKLFLRLITR